MLRMWEDADLQGVGLGLGKLVGDRDGHSTEISGLSKRARHPGWSAQVWHILGMREQHE